jgi:hypothetical protein
MVQDFPDMMIRKRALCLIILEKPQRVILALRQGLYSGIKLRNKENPLWIKPEYSGRRLNKLLFGQMQTVTCHDQIEIAVDL